MVIDRQACVDQILEGTRHEIGWMSDGRSDRCHVGTVSSVGLGTRGLRIVVTTERGDRVVNWHMKEVDAGEILAQYLRQKTQRADAHGRPLWKTSGVFTGGVLKGLPRNEITSVRFTPGQDVTHPIGGSPYKILNVEPA